MAADQTSEAIIDPIVDIADQGKVEHIFSTPIFWHVLRNVDALNGELRDLILARELNTPSMSKSNQGGWQSAPDFFNWSGSSVATLERYVVSALNAATARLLVPSNLVFEFEVYGWAAVNRKGHYNTPHIHPMATWSGTYYVDAGDEPADGPGAVLEFSHPITASIMTFFPGVLPSARVVRPQTGMIILFPSYLQHSVRMYRGDRPRVAVPFNAHVRRITT